MLRSWRAVLLLTAFLQILGFGLVLPLLPYFGRSLGADGAQIGALFAAYSLTQFLAAPLWGALADRFGRRPIMLVSIAGGILAYLLFALAQSFAVLLASRVLAGVSAGVIGVSQAYLADRTESEERAGEMGLLWAAFGAGFVVGPALGAVLSRWGYATAGYVAAVLAAGNLILALRWLPESLTPERRQAVAWGKGTRRLAVVARADLRGALAIVFFNTVAFSVLYPVFPLFVQDRLGYGPLQAGILFSLMGLLGVLVQGSLLGKLTGWIGERPLIRAGCLLMALGLVALPLSFVKNVVALAMILLPMALGFAVISPTAFTVLSRLSDPAEQAVNLGVGQSAASLARALGPLAGGFLFDHMGTPYPFWLAALMVLAAFATVRAIPPVADRRSPLLAGTGGDGRLAPVLSDGSLTAGSLESGRVPAGPRRSSVPAGESRAPAAPPDLGG
jgi:multidrug resistance protein